MPAKPMLTKFGVSLLTAEDPLNCYDYQLGFVRKALTRLCIGSVCWPPNLRGQAVSPKQRLRDGQSFADKI